MEQLFFNFSNANVAMFTMVNIAICVCIYTDLYNPLKDTNVDS